MPSTDKTKYIIDANVLIDYLNVDISILALLSEEVGQLYLARSVFEEVRELSESEVARNSFEILTPSLELAMQARSKRSRLSYQDHETLLLAKHNELVCVTNDRALHKEATLENLTLMWGMEPMKILVSHGILSKSTAKKTAKLIQLANPKFITLAILGKFITQIDEIVL